MCDFNTCLKSANDYDKMMVQLGKDGNYGFSSAHSQKLSIDPANCQKLFDIYLRDFTNPPKSSADIANELSSSKQPQTYIFSEFNNDETLIFFACDVSHQVETHWFGLVKKPFYKVEIIDMKVHIKSKEYFLHCVQTYLDKLEESN